MYSGLNNLGLTGLRPPFSLSTIFTASTQGMWVEASAPPVTRRNLLTYSEDLTNAVYAGNNLAAVGRRIDGLGDSLIPTAVLGQHFLRHTGYSSLTNRTQTVSVKVKPNGLNFFGLVIDNTIARAKFQFTPAQSTGVSGTNTSTTISGPDAAGYYLLTFTFDGGAGQGNIWLVPQTAYVDPITTYTGDGVNGVLIQYVQVEANTLPSQYQRVTDWSTEFLESIGYVAQRNLATVTDGPIGAAPPWNLNLQAFAISATELACGNGGPAYLTKIQQVTNVAAATPVAMGPAPATTFTVSGYFHTGNLSGISLLIRNGTTATSLNSTGLNSAGVVAGGWLAIPIGNGISRVFVTVTTGFSVGDQVQFYVGATGAVVPGSYWYTGGVQMELGSVLSAYQPIGTSYTSTYPGPSTILDYNLVDGFGNGPITSAGVGNTVGMMIDRKSPVRGPNLYPAILSTNFTISGNDATHIVTFNDTLGIVRYQSDTTTPVLQFIPTTAPLTIGKWYEVVINVSAYTSGSLKIDAVNGAVIVASKLGLNRAIIQAAQTTPVAYRNSPNVDLTLSQVQIKEIIGATGTMYQNTGASPRPTFSAKVNILNKTEALNDGIVWTPSSAGVASVPLVTGGEVAPNGTATAFKVVMALNGGVTLGDSAQLIATSIVINNGASYTSGFWIKAFSAGDIGKVVVTRHVAGTTYTPITLQANWTFFSLPEIGNSVITSTTLVALRGTTGSSDSATCVVWHPDIRLTSDTTKGYPVYQRVSSTSDYDTVGFPYRVAFDNVDDYISATSATSFSSNTDIFYLMRRNSGKNVLGVMVQNSGGNNFGIYDGSDAVTGSYNGVGSPTQWVNGVQVPGGIATTRAQLDGALPQNSWCVYEVQGADLSTWTGFGVGFFSAFTTDTLELAAVIVCPAQSDGVRKQIRSYLGQKVGLTL